MQIKGLVPKFGASFGLCLLLLGLLHYLDEGLCYITPTADPLVTERYGQECQYFPAVTTENVSHCNEMDTSHYLSGQQYTCIENGPCPGNWSTLCSTDSTTYCINSYFCEYHCVKKLEYIQTMVPAECHCYGWTTPPALVDKKPIFATWFANQRYVMGQDWYAPRRAFMDTDSGDYIVFINPFHTLRVIILGWLFMSFVIATLQTLIFEIFGWW